MDNFPAHSVGKSKKMENKFSRSDNSLNYFVGKPRKTENKSSFQRNPMEKSSPQHPIMTSHPCEFEKCFECKKFEVGNAVFVLKYQLFRYKHNCNGIRCVTCSIKRTHSKFRTLYEESKKQFNIKRLWNLLKAKEWISMDLAEAHVSYRDHRCKVYDEAIFGCSICDGMRNRIIELELEMYEIKMMITHATPWV